MCRARRERPPLPWVRDRCAAWRAHRAPALAYRARRALAACNARAEGLALAGETWPGSQPAHHGGARAMHCSRRRDGAWQGHSLEARTWEVPAQLVVAHKFKRAYRYSYTVRTHPHSIQAAQNLLRSMPASCSAQRHTVLLAKGSGQATVALLIPHVHKASSLVARKAAARPSSRHGRTPSPWRLRPWHRWSSVPWC